MHGPWATTDCIYDSRDVQVLNTTSPHWVIKSCPHGDESMYELSNFLRVTTLDVKNAVETHPELYYRFGISETKIWYAMRAYDGHVTNNEFCRQHWKRIACGVLRFLCSLHHTTQLVHMDIKTSNVLINILEVQFVVGDFDQTDICTNELTHTYEDDILWYYVAMGAELDQPLKSWRFDLVSLGYMLANLTWSADNSPWIFFPECQARRQGRGSLALSDTELIALRENEIAKSHPLVLQYLEIIKELPWDAPVPPSKAFYKRLMSVFSS